MVQRSYRTLGPVPDSDEVTKLPTGTVTFVMTDIEGSTRLLQTLGRAYSKVLEDHYVILRESFGAHGGVEVSTNGDAVFFAFDDAASAAAATVDVQRRFKAHDWPAGTAVRVRIGVHTGKPTIVDRDYVGIDLHRAARIAAAAHGGQIVVSDAARGLMTGLLPDDAYLHDLGEHRLKDLEHPERLGQLVAPGLDTAFPPLRGAESRSHNLPSAASTFVGRRREKSELLRILADHRLVTLTGPGGTGKTRLSLAVAEAALGDFRDGVHFVALAAISRADEVVPTIAAAFNLRENATRPTQDVLIDYLRPRSLLLLLDNFEQVIGAALTVGVLLSGAGQLKILVTSREPLQITGEQVFPVPPLAVPSPQVVVGPEDLADIESVDLFVQRARSVRPGFALTVDNARAVAELCERLDGLPLAIELAAARSSLFDPSELLARLDRRLSQFTGGRDLPERQRTLRGAIDWSHDLLDDAHQVVFRRLSVFPGGWSIEAADQVCLPQEVGLDCVEALSSLRDKSLVFREDARRSVRLGMLETIAQYARERLEESKDSPEILRRRAVYFAELAEAAAGQITGGPDQDLWFDVLDTEIDNLRAVIRWSIDTRAVEHGLRIVAAVGPFWLFRNHTKEGRRHIADLLSANAADVPAALRAAALDVAADLATYQSDYLAVPALANEALIIHRELGNLAAVALQLGNLGYAMIMSNPDRALEYFRDSVAVYRDLGSPTSIAAPLVGLAVIDMRHGELDDAVAHLHEARLLWEQAEDEHSVIIPIGLAGMAARLRGDVATARAHYVEVLNRSRRSGQFLGYSLALSGLADLALQRGDAELAAILDAAQQELTEQLGGTPTFELLGISAASQRARAELGDERYEAAASRGRSTPINDVLDLALDDGRSE